MLFEDDVRLADHFMSKLGVVIEEMRKQASPPLFVSLFSVKYGPPGWYFPYSAYTQAVLFRNGADLQGAVDTLLSCEEPLLCDTALATYRVGERAGRIRYPSLVQHVGRISVAIPDRDTKNYPVAPTFSDQDLTWAVSNQHRLHWLVQALLRRVRG